MQQSFWQFSLAVYAEPGVAEECLALQAKFDLDVNLLLFCAYMGAVRGVAMSDRDVRQAIGIVVTWHHSVVKALRGVRRALKVIVKEQSHPIAEELERYRSTIKAAELEAERFEHSWLEDWSRSASPQTLGVDENAAMTANIAALLAACGHSFQPTDLPNHLMAAALGIGRPLDVKGSA